MKYSKLFDHIIMSVLSRISAKTASRYIYYRIFHKKLNLNKPKTFNEQLMWLKLNKYTNNALVTQCADKYEVRKYVTNCGCAQLLIPLLGVWENPNDITFDNLPNAFVLKCNHGCGYNIICPDKAKLNIQDTIKLLTKWINTDFWVEFAETNYKDIPKRIIAESYIGFEDGSPPLDYKFYCFHGKAAYVMVCCEREKSKPKFYFFDRQWELQRINPDSLRASKNFSLPKPTMLDEMFDYADLLSAPFPFVRVDLYAIDDSIKFGELTFTPGAALDNARLPLADKLFYHLLESQSTKNKSF